MIQILTILSVLTVSTHSWLLQASQTNILVGRTKNVSLTCRYDGKDHGQMAIANVLLIKIKRLQGNKDLATFKVQVGLDKPVVSPDDGQHPAMAVQGHVGKPNDSFLSITWSLSSSGTVGEYSCLVGGFTDIDTIVMVDTINPISVIDSPFSVNELLALISGLETGFRHIQNEFNITISGIEKAINNMTKMFQNSLSKQRDMAEKDISNLTHTIQTSLAKERGMTEKDISNLREMIEKNISNLRYMTEKDISNLRDMIEKNISNLTHASQANQELMWRKDIDAKPEEALGIVPWPEGRYALLNTVNGCPSYEWLEGYVKMFTESGKYPNQDKVSNNSHLAGPVIVRQNGYNFFYLRTCKRNTSSTGPAWPKGSYCIHRVGDSCPVGFESGLLRMDAEDDGSQRSDVLNEPDGDYTHFNNIGLFYCCRSDGKLDVPITLPIRQSFILYRHKGKCQEVAKAKVTEEWILINTEDEYNIDRMSGSLDSRDMKINPVQMYLCYYTPLV